MSTSVANWGLRIKLDNNIIKQVKGVLEEVQLPDKPDIVIKPNWVQQSHEYKLNVWEPVITNPTLILMVVSIIADKINGKGTICICDAPHTYADFDAIINRGGLKEKLQEIRDNWLDLKLELLDLRREVWERKEEVVVSRSQNPDDPNGYIKFNLAKDSLFYKHPGERRYYGADYNSKVVNEHHKGETQEYLVAGTPMKCDLFINMPKIKTHKKTGITCCLKNLVGINGDKNWLPHHVEGSPRDKGDEFPEKKFINTFERVIKKMGRKIALNLPFFGTWLYRKMRNSGKKLLGDSETVIRNGNWEGNDTCWRMALDLNRALLYGNMDGTWREVGEAKNYLAIVDGIIAGEGNGPLCPDPVEANVVVVGTNPAETDAVVAQLMGFKPTSIPIVREAFAEHRWPIGIGRMEDIKVFDKRIGKEINIKDIKPVKAGGFKPHFGWTHLLGSTD